MLALGGGPRATIAHRTFVKLLLDAHVSHRLVPELQELFPDSSHVRVHGLQRTDDEVIWEFAKANDFIIVTKDADFHEKSLLRGFPPKIIWLRMGNCPRRVVLACLKQNAAEIRRFVADEEYSYLILS